MRRFVLAAAATVAALAMLAPEAGAQNLTNCTTAGQNRYVNDVMRDIYYWNTELPTVNTASFGRPKRCSRPCDSVRSTSASATSARGRPKRRSTPTASSSGSASPTATTG